VPIISSAPTIRRNGEVKKKKMPKYLSLWKVNTSLISLDPTARLKNFEAQAHAIDSAIKSGAIKEFGFFNVESGYAVIETPTREEAMNLAALFYPYVQNDPHEIIPWENAKKVMSSAYEMQVKLATG
jgi:hypothetical protein